MLKKQCHGYTPTELAKIARISSKYAEKENINMDKPLKGWTLGELKDWCYQYRILNTTPCEKHCDMHKRGICLKDWVHDWDLEEKPRFTPEEVKNAKAIRRIFNNRYDAIVKDKDGRGNLWLYNTEIPFADMQQINSDTFPTLKDGEKITLSDIIGEN